MSYRIVYPSEPHSMANYVAHYTKKQQAVRRWEDQLRRLVSAKVSEAELMIAVEEVREARIRALQARLATIPPADGPDTKASVKIVAGIEALREIPARVILAEFR